MSDFNSRDYTNGYRDGRIEAADEITNLRTEIERLKAEAKANLDLAERHMNEKHKLRAALDRLRDVSRLALKLSQQHDDFKLWGMDQMWDALAAADRAALEENEG